MNYILHNHLVVQIYKIPETMKITSKNVNRTMCCLLDNPPLRVCSQKSGTVLRFENPVITSQYQYTL